MIIITEDGRALQGRISQTLLRPEQAAKSNEFLDKWFAWYDRKTASRISKDPEVLKAADRAVRQELEDYDNGSTDDV